jgi:hypothetical protein
MVSQFMVELVGTKVVDGEAPPRILHFNPRIRGDYSGKPVIEMNSCYRMQWGRSQRCEGYASRPAEETGELRSSCFRFHWLICFGLVHVDLISFNLAIACSSVILEIWLTVRRLDSSW